MTNVQEHAVGEPDSDARSRRRLEFFDRHQQAYVPAMGDNVSAPDPDVEGLDLAAIAMQTLTEDREADGISCLLFEFPPNFVGPRHHHDCDQVVYIVEGSMKQGNRVLGPGAGFFTRSGASYSVQVGPAGVRFLEFRPVTTFDTIIDEKPGVSEESSLPV